MPLGNNRTCLLFQDSCHFRNIGTEHPNLTQFLKQVESLQGKRESAVFENETFALEPAQMERLAGPDEGTPLKSKEIPCSPLQVPLVPLGTKSAS